jgi:hypothetical protein
VKTPVVELGKQTELSATCYQDIIRISARLDEVKLLRQRITGLKFKATGDALTTLTSEEASLARLEGGGGGGRRGRPTGNSQAGYNQIKTSLLALMSSLQGSDMPVTTQMADGVIRANDAMEKLDAQLAMIKKNLQ